MADIKKELEALREKLLDLSLNNNLLNYSVSKKRTIEILNDSVSDIYNTLVVDNKSMRFRSADFEDKKDNYIYTKYEQDEIEDVLFYVRNQAQTVFEEQGYPTLFMAIGFLEWNDFSGSKRDLSSPLILVPIRLNRTGMRRIYSVEWTGNELSVSITLKAKMAEMGIEIPEFENQENKKGIEEYFKSVEENIKQNTKCSDWKVKRTACIDFFNFKKFVMYKDLDPNIWPEGEGPETHPLIKKLLDPDQTEDDGFLESDVDKKLTSADVYHIVDADSSQIAVIEDVKAGRNLVVEGPPGTGKSQTITNLIAELLGQNKSVLFVSEKMAALQVVKQRLDTVGLGSLCLEIHSNKAQKKELLNELEKTLNAPKPPEKNFKHVFDELENIKYELNEYARSLREKIGPSNQSVYEIYGMRENIARYFKHNGRVMQTVTIENPEKWTVDDLTNSKACLERMAGAYEILKTIKNNPWNGCEPGIILPPDIIKIREKMSALEFERENLFKSFGNIVKQTGLSMPESVADTKSMLVRALYLSSFPKIESAVLNNKDWIKQTKIPNALIEKSKKYVGLKEYINSTFSQNIEKADLDTFLKKSSKFTRIFDSEFKNIKEEIESCYIIKKKRKNSEIKSDVKLYIEHVELKNEIENENKNGIYFFGSDWDNIKYEPEELQRIAECIKSFNEINAKSKKSGNYEFSDIVVLKIEHGIDREKVVDAVEDLEIRMRNLEQNLSGLSEKLGIPKNLIFEEDMTIRKDVKYDDLSNKIKGWNESLEELVLWSRYRADRAECLKSVAKPFVEIIDNDLVLPEDIIPTFKGNYADSMLRYAFREERSLSTFICEVHENKIKKFIEYDKDILSKNRERLRIQGYENLPKMTTGVIRDSEKGILLNEFNKKRGHMPIRKLMLNAGGLIQKIKPCFMMSPLSIAQYLDPKTSRFDVIIFDEASQVRPEDALGALLRGKQVVVMGDSKQLPPTTFFENMFANDEYIEDDIYTDMESVLNMCKRSFPHKTLLWHYRSRHESLIEVSNREFYSDRLYVYPSPYHDDLNMGLHLNYNPDTIYDRGKTGVNREEARIVAHEVVRHFIRFPEKTLGVGTFNTKQQQAIQYEIEKLIRESPGFEKYLVNDKGENFFVKNIETIQGDERDVIFISIGFGFDQNGKMSNNFGPINKEGGERRLNVLFTRAREKCVIFSNFRAIDMSINETSPAGLVILSKFLRHAEFRTNNLDAITDGTSFPKDSFENAVLEFLKENGHIIHTKIGCAGYRIDMALESKKNPGYFYLGVECDGPQYHSSEVARDRDRLRKQVLEGLGWNLYRVWSTEWYMSPEKCKRDLLKAIEEAKEKAKNIKIENEKINDKDKYKKGKDQKTTETEADETEAVEKMKKILEAADLSKEKIMGKREKELKVIEQKEEKEKEAERKEEEKREMEELEKELKYRDIKIREEKEQKEREQREREQKEREQREREQKERELREREQKERELIEREQKEREQREIEQKERELREREQKEREQREREQKEREQRERELREREQKEREKEQREIEQKENEKKERKQKIQRENDFDSRSEETSRGHENLIEFERDLDLNHEFEYEYNGTDEQGSGDGGDYQYRRVHGIPTYDDLMNIDSMLENGVPDYEKYEDLKLPSTENLSEVPRHTLEHEIVDLVKFEGPVHKERVIKAIKDKCDIKRMTKDTREMIIREISMAEMSGYIYIRGNIIWPPYKKQIIARKREGDLLNIDHISEQEIFQMAIYVLTTQFSMPKDSLLKQISVEFGFKVLRENIRNRIENVVDRAIENKYIVILPNGKLYLEE